MGDDDICHGNLIGRNRARYIISFGEDENGTKISEYKIKVSMSSCYSCTQIIVIVCMTSLVWQKSKRVLRKSAYSCLVAFSYPIIF